MQEDATSGKQVTGMGRPLGTSEFMRRWTSAARDLAKEWALPVEQTDGLAALFVAFLRMHATLGVFSFGPLTISLAVVEDLARRKRWGGKGDYREFTNLLQSEIARGTGELDEVIALLALMKIQRGLPGRVFGELGVRPETIEDYVRTGRRAETDLERLFSPEEAASYLNVNVATVRNWIRSGRLPANRLAGERFIRIRASALSRILEPIEPSGDGRES